MDSAPLLLLRERKRYGEAKGEKTGLNNGCPGVGTCRAPVQTGALLMLWRGVWRGTIVIALVVAGGVLALAPGQVAMAVEPQIADGRTPRGQKLLSTLDHLLTDKQYAALGEALEREHKAGRGRVARDWQDRRLRDGGSAYLGFVYSRELMRSAAQAAARQQPGVRERAAFIAIYTMAVLTIDGPRCADAAAPSVRSEQLFDLAAEAFSWAADMPQDRRDRVIDDALALERATAYMRRDDAFICLGGAGNPTPDPEERASRNDGHAATGPADADAPAAPGEPVDAQFAGEDASRPLQALARRTIRADLCRMLDQMRS